MAVSFFVSQTSLHTLPHAGRDPSSKNSSAAITVRARQTTATTASNNLPCNRIICPSVLRTLAFLVVETSPALPIHLPANPKDIGIRVRHSHIDKIYHFT